MKILVRGSSIAAGFGVKRSYVDRLISDPDFSGWQIINSSSIKDNSFDCVWGFQKEIEPYSPDILVLHFGIDDAYFPVYRSEFKENLVQTVRLSRKLFDPVIILMTSHPFEDQYEMQMINIYYRTIREVAVDLSCELVPVHTYISGYLLENNLSLYHFLLDDNRYPNEKGHDLYLEALKNKLLRLSKNFL